MTRIRQCRPDFHDDERLAEVSRDARATFRSMWHWLDRNGVGKRSAKFWKGKIYPYDDDLTSNDVEVWLKELIDNGFLKVITHEGLEYFICEYMVKEQKFHRDEKPKYNVPLEQLPTSNLAGCKNASDTTLTPCLEPTGTLPKSVNAKANSAGNGERGISNGERATENAKSPSSTKIFIDGEEFNPPLKENGDFYTPAELADDYNKYCSPYTGSTAAFALPRDSLMEFYSTGQHKPFDTREGWIEVFKKVKDQKKGIENGWMNLTTLVKHRTAYGVLYETKYIGESLPDEPVIELDKTDEYYENWAKESTLEVANG